MKTKRFNFTAIIAVAISALLVFTSLITSVGAGGKARAETRYYSGVLEDLQTDENFNAADYPAIAYDYSLQVIQIAEGTAGELFIYVYNPSALKNFMRATSINISQTTGDNLHYKNYALTLINNYGVFAKYVVQGLTVPAKAERTYDITSISRKWVEGIDDDPGNGQTVSEVPYEVAQLWTATTGENGEVNYTNTVTEVVIIKDKFVGAVRLSNGISWTGIESCDAHFVAFSSNWRIDQLFEADVEFTTQKWATNSISGTSYGDVTPHAVTLKAENKGGYVNKYSWKEIETVAEFLSHDYTFEDGLAESLLKYQYVLRIHTSEYSETLGGTSIALSLLFGPLALITLGNSSGEYVSDVSVLRLNFETAGTVYNLGVVDNKQTGSRDPVGFGNGEGMPWWGWLIIAAVVLLVLVLLCALIKPVMTAVTGILKAVFFILSLPFRGIAAIIKAAQNRKNK